MPEYAGQLLTNPRAAGPDDRGIAHKLRMKQSLTEDEKKVIAFIEDCDAYVFILDPQLREVVAEDTEYDRLLLQQDYISIAKKMHDDGVNRKPVCLLATKWDLVQKEIGDEAGVEDYIRGKFGYFVTDIEGIWMKNKISFLRVGLKTNNEGKPGTPLSPIGFDEILRWLFSNL
jgi:hypothetical protein